MSIKTAGNLWAEKTSPRAMTNIVRCRCGISVMLVP